MGRRGSGIDLGPKSLSRVSCESAGFTELFFDAESGAGGNGGAELLVLAACQR